MPLDDTVRSTLAEGAKLLGTYLDESQIGQFERYVELLLLWGRKINLTSRRSAKEIVRYHFLDSLAPLFIIRPEASGRLADIGTGAGFPGIPLKIVRPGIRLSLIESSHKKMSFCREVSRRLGLKEVQYIEERAEDAIRSGTYLQAFDWIVARAFGQAAQTLRLALPLLAPRGSLILFKGSPGSEEVAALESEAAGHHLSVQRVPISVPFLDDSRTLLIVGPVSSSSPGFS